MSFIICHETEIEELKMKWKQKIGDKSHKLLFSIEFLRIQKTVQR